MKEQFKQAIEDNSEHVPYESGHGPYDIVFIESAAAECERICEERMGAFAEWVSNNQFALIDCTNSVWQSTKIHYSGNDYTTAELIKLFNETNS